MPNRPAIPAEITRQILVESGHRCAVCGAGCPLERAHIIPWHKSKEHKAEDLICLCATCHERADIENWGEKTLREYKEKPWILRQLNHACNPFPTTKVEVVINMEYSEFGETQSRMLQYALAKFLEISVSEVKIISMEETNSVKVMVELPSLAAQKLILEHEKSSPKLQEELFPFDLINIRESEVAYDSLTPVPLLDKDSEQYRITPKTLMEEYLAGILMQVLHLDNKPSPQDNFFELGGDSLSVLVLVMRIRKIFEIDFRLSKLFELQTVASIAEEIVTQLKMKWDTSHSTVQRVLGESGVPLSTVDSDIKKEK